MGYFCSSSLIRYAQRCCRLFKCMMEKHRAFGVDKWWGDLSVRPLMIETFSFIRNAFAHALTRLTVLRGEKGLVFVLF